jgi:hypothetical protein
VLDVAQIVVSGMVATDFVAVVDVGGCDVAMELLGSGCEKGGWGVCRDVVSRLGRVYRRFREAGGSFGAGAEGVVAVVDGADGAVDSSDVAGNGDGGGLVAVVWVLESTRNVVSAFFVEVGVSSSGSSVCRAAHQRSWAGLVW